MEKASLGQRGHAAFASPLAGYRVKLVKLLGMLGSDHDGERANAARLADEHRRKSGLTWHDLVLPIAEDPPRKARKPRKAKPRKPPEPPPPPPPTWQDKAREVETSGRATEWELSFVGSLLTRWSGRELTEKQAAVLERLWAKCQEKAA
jgi:hypothetical protein